MVASAISMVAAGESGRGAAQGTKADKAWPEAKREILGDLDTWESSSSPRSRGSA